MNLDDKDSCRDRAATDITITETMVATGIDAARALNVECNPGLVRAVFNSMWRASKVAEALESGFVLVPKKPTEKMLYEAFDAATDEDAGEVWLEMIEAAPELSL